MKSLDQVIRKVSKDTGYNLTDIRSVVDFYFTDIRRELINPTTNNIFIPKIGTFSLSLFKINSLIYKTIKKIREIQKTDRYTLDTQQELIEQRKEKIRKYWIHRNKLIKEYGERKEKLEIKRAESIS